MGLFLSAKGGYGAVNEAERPLRFTARIKRKIGYFNINEKIGGDGDCSKADL